ncbi:hypothetical protein CPB86DRAFT_869463 [Serendipita vermifera]|nr:hypothetical protein CPB86DRAFT_869463 [Serendipita vermifera]
MLSTNTQPNTRPRPPAQLRRSQNSALGSKDAQSPPPPPYEISSDVANDATPLHKRHLSVCSVSSNVDPSVIATAQMLGLNLEGAADQDRLLDEEYIRDKSKEELEKLLLKAEAVIRARERELSVAAAVGKQLLDTNLNLRTRHASIMSRTSPHPGFETPSRNSMASPPMSPLLPASSQPFRTPNQTHTRRLSTSPSQLAILSSQNEDLIQAVSKLQDETNAANVEGKQKLRKLEKEIAGLRAELDQSHQKNGELEERIDKVKSEHERQMEAQRLERETHTSGQRRDHPSSEEGSPGYQNYAPMESFTPSKRKGSVGVNSQTSTPESVPFPSAEAEVSRPNPHTGEPSPELTLLGQLLSKIQELEATNREILERYRDTDTRLRNASTRSNALTKFYDNLEDEMHADDEAGTFSADQSPLGASLSRSKGIMYSIHNQSAKSLRERGSPVSSLRGATEDLLSSHSSQTRRPPLSGLFDDPASSDQGDHLRVEAPTDDSDFEAHHNAPSGSGISNLDRLKLRPSASLLSRRRLRPKASLDTRSLKAHGNSSQLSLPAKSVRTSKSYHGLSKKEQGHASSQANARTLLSEMEDGLGDDAQPGTALSLLNLNLENNSDAELNESTIVQKSGEVDYTDESRLAQENQAVSAIRSALDFDKYGKPLEDGEHILPVGSLEGSPGETFFLLSRAVSARPNKWTPPVHRRRGLVQDSLSRMKQMALPSSMSLQLNPNGSRTDPWETEYPEDSETDANRRHTRRRSSSKTSKHGSARGSDDSRITRRRAAVSRLNRTALARADYATDQENHPIDEAAENVQDDNQLVELEAENMRHRDNLEANGWSRTLLEIWIILQAAIILVVFVYSMARRGPRAILDAAEVKRRPGRQ